MHSGDTVWLESVHDLHSLWCQQHARDRSGHVWVYEADGRSRWRARITRRSDDDR